MVTIFTPSYNRASFLPRVYECLCKQTSHDFEWLIVDDGSIDNTNEVIINIQQQHVHSFPIAYLRKENGGKHTAINLGVKKAKGELFLILDSDDSLPESTVSDVLQRFNLVAHDESLAGICGLMAHHNGVKIGSGFPEEMLVANSLELRFKYRVTGDLMEVWKTSVLRENPFPEINGERFCPEQLLWFRIAYRLLCINKVIYYRDYLDGGLTDNIVKVRMKSPIASTMFYGELNQYDIPFMYKVKAAINYWRFRFCIRKGNVASISCLWAVVIPIAYAMHIVDTFKIKKFAK